MAIPTQDLLNATREAFIEENAIDIHIQAHPLLNVFWNQKIRQSGGKTIDFRVRTNQPGDLQFYTNETVPPANENEIIENATLPWRKAIYEMSLMGDLSYTGKGEGEIIDLARETMEAGQAGLIEELAWQLMNGAGGAGALHGLPAVFANPYAGIDSGVVTKWGAVDIDAGGGALTADMLDDVLGRLQERGAQTQVIVMARADRDKLNSFIDERTRYATPGGTTLEIGQPARLFHSGAEVLIDPDLTAGTIYFLDLRKFHLVMADDSERMFNLTPWEFRINQSTREDAFRSYALFAGNFMCRDKRRQGRLTNFT